MNGFPNFYGNQRIVEIQVVGYVQRVHNKATESAGISWESQVQIEILMTFTPCLTNTYFYLS